MKSLLIMLLSIPLALMAEELPKEWCMPQQQAVPDTIYVSDTETTYLLFTDEVVLVDIGRTGEYFARIEGKSVFLKARDQQSGPTNILIRFGQAYFTARLIFADKQEQYLYTIDKTATRSGPDLHSEQVDEIPDGSTILDRLHKLTKEPEEQPVRQRSRHGLRLRITHLQHDRQAIYLGLDLSNSSSIDYCPDFVGFSFEEKRGRWFSRNNRHRKEVRPYGQEAMARIPGFGNGSLFYALPLYAMTKRGKLRIQVREKGGSRVLSISIPARKINQSPIIAQSHEN